MVVCALVVSLLVITISGYAGGECGMVRIFLVRDKNFFFEPL